MNDSHSCTSMAVKAVIKELKSRLYLRFNFLPVPEFYYDIEKGLSEQFKQYLAKIPFEERKDSWIALAYSYDSAEKSTVQPRNGFTYKRPVSDGLKRMIDVTYCNLPLLCSIMTNDSKLFNALHTVLYTKCAPSFSVQYQDLLWPTWTSNRFYPLGWYIRPSKPNGRLYVCDKEGVSGDVEPQWSDDLSNLQDDNTVSWKCVSPSLLTVKANDFVKNNVVIQNPIENGIMYQVDFGYTLHYADLEDSGDLKGIVKQVQLDLLELYDDKTFGPLLDRLEINS